MNLCEGCDTVLSVLSQTLDALCGSGKNTLCTPFLSAVVGENVPGEDEGAGGEAAISSVEG